MKRQAVEISVGFFVLIGLVCVAYLAVNLGGLEWFGKDSYCVTARFTSAAGLKDGAVVNLAGVQIGKVLSIRLDPEEMLAVVVLKVNNSVPLTDDVIASIKTSGLIGDKYVEIAPGGSDILLKDGDEIIETESTVDLEEVISKYAFGDV
jgi:phospholipid/cholesterol/gamma-HCH transport system substrate-binding protein